MIARTRTRSARRREARREHIRSARWVNNNDYAANPSCRTGFPGLMMTRLIYHPAPAHALASSTARFDHTAQQCAHRTAPILLHPIRRRRHPDITAPACGLRGTARPRAPPTPTHHWPLPARACVLRGATPRARTRRRIGAEKAGALFFGSVTRSSGARVRSTGGAARHRERAAGDMRAVPRRRRARRWAGQLYFAVAT